MNMKITGYVLIAAGLTVLIFSLAADFLGVGKGGLSAYQLLGAQIGVILSLMGTGLIVAHNNNKIQTKKYGQIFFAFIHDNPVMASLLAGFLVTYILFFLFPAIFNENFQFRYFDRYLPDGSRLGIDVKEIVTFLKDRLTNQNIVDGQPYPPLFRAIFAPLILISYPQAYFVITVISLISYFLLTFIIPGLIAAKKDFSLILLFFLSGLFSYGWQFELERGQFNIITFALCLLAVYLYHYHKEYRHFAYLFFSIAVQLKIYPLIFIVMFVKDWKDWKNNIQRMIGLGLFNFALLFILGYSVFLDWFKSVSEFTTNPPTAIEDHSIKVFVALLTKDGLNIFQGNTLTWIRQQSDLITTLLFGYFALCFLSIVIVSYVRNKPGLNGYLLLACTLGAMLVPSLSYDYKLAILAAPMAIAFNQLSIVNSTLKKGLSLVVIFFASIAYSTTLYPFKYRPDFLVNSMPLLFVILTAITILYLINGDDTQKDIQEI